MRRIARRVYYRTKFLLINLLKKKRKPSYGPKVFCLGFNKTGTTTLGKSFEMLGYRNCSFNEQVYHFYEAGEIDKVLEYAALYDSFDDRPWFLEDMIPILDKTFPNSKFVYLKREEEAWKKSLNAWMIKVFGEYPSQYPNLEEALELYRNHEKFVLNYFKHRSEKDFIVLDVRDEKGFQKLATFLGKKTMQEAFPHHNKTELLPDRQGKFV